MLRRLTVEPSRAVQLAVVNQLILLSDFANVCY